MEWLIHFILCCNWHFSLQAWNQEEPRTNLWRFISFVKFLMKRDCLIYLCVLRYDSAELPFINHSIHSLNLMTLFMYLQTKFWDTGIIMSMLLFQASEWWWWILNLGHGYLQFKTACIVNYLCIKKNKIISCSSYVKKSKF